jgi:predicted transcriptional regulator of viral defense system
MTYRQVLWRHALNHHGLVTTSDAERLHIPSVELRKLAARGFMVNRARGVYRVHDAPESPTDQFAEAVSTVGGDAHLTGDAVLALHDLAHVNPRRIRVATTRRIRGRVPDFIEVVHGTQPEDEITTYDGIRSSTVARALLDCQASVMADRLRQAAHDAAERGLLTRREREQVEQALGGEAGQASCAPTIAGVS